MSKIILSAVVFAIATLLAPSPAEAQVYPSRVVSWWWDNPDYYTRAYFDLDNNGQYDSSEENLYYRRGVIGYDELLLQEGAPLNLNGGDPMMVIVWAYDSGGPYSMVYVGYYSEQAFSPPRFLVTAQYTVDDWVGPNH